MDSPALAIIEFGSIAVGTRATDALVKKAPVRLERVGSFQPGRFAALFVGDVASVEESFVEGLRVGAESLLDRLMLPHVEPTVLAAALGAATDWDGECLGVIEASTLSGVVEAADAAVKGANVRLVQVRLGAGLGGKGLAHFAGSQVDIEAAIEIGLVRAQRHDRTICASIIPRLDADLRSALSRGTRLFEGQD